VALFEGYEVDGWQWEGCVGGEVAAEVEEEAVGVGVGRVWGLEEGECLVEGGRYVPGEGMSEPVCTAGKGF
jgi:hypothetical protein